ncbi:MAG: acyltransferase [Sphingobacteriales bacterium]|nr:acyltransferase [Sphingobacteriales bacterium]
MRVKLFLYIVASIELLRGVILFLQYKMLGVKFSSGKALRISAGTSFRVYNKKASIRFGKNNYIRKSCSVVVGDGVLKIGDNFFMNNFSSVNCFGVIEIGNDCLIGEGVRLYDHNYDYRSAENLPLNKKGHRKGFISIGNNCWLGTNTVVLMDVKIGNNVIIGANNLVYKDVPDNSIILAKQDPVIRAYKTGEQE